MSEPVHFPARPFNTTEHWTKFLTDAERFVGEQGLVGGLYRFYDSERNLLYVGQTSYFPNRWTNHRDDAEWWTEAAYVAVSFFPSGCPISMQEAEKASILIEQPRCNVHFRNVGIYDPRRFQPYLAPPGFPEE